MKASKLASVGFLVFASAIILFYGLRYLQNQSFQSSSFSFKVIFNDLKLIFKPGFFNIYKDML